jgi:hypothetical protein
MSRSTILNRGRQRASESFIDACVIEHPTGVTTDDLTGATVITYAAPTYSGPARFQIGANSSSGGRAESGEASIVLLGISVQIPVVGTEGVERGDRVTCTASVNDPDLPGRQFFVENLSPKSEATARRLGIVEAT